MILLPTKWNAIGAVEVTVQTVKWCGLWFEATWRTSEEFYDRILSFVPSIQFCIECCDVSESEHSSHYLLIISSGFCAFFSFGLLHSHSKCFWPTVRVIRSLNFWRLSASIFKEAIQKNSIQSMISSAKCTDENLASEYWIWQRNTTNLEKFWRLFAFFCSGCCWWILAC